MKFKKILQDAELPEKSGDRYINVRASERVDVRPKEIRDIATGIAVMVSKDEIATTVGEYVIDSVLEPGPYRPLYVTIYNPTDRNLLFYIGQPIASIILEEVKPKHKTTTLTSIATLSDKEPTFVRKPCKECP